MGKLLLKGGGRLPATVKTERAFDLDVDISEVDRVLTGLADALAEHPSKVCFIYGMGAQPKSTYTQFLDREDVSLVFYRSVLPPPLRLLRFVIASYEGLIKVRDTRVIPQVFKSLLKKAMVGLYIFDKELEQRFISEVNGDRTVRHYDFGIMADEEFVIYLVDGDSSESKTGLIEIVRYGPQAIWKGF